MRPHRLFTELKEKNVTEDMKLGLQIIQSSKEIVKKFLIDLNLKTL